MTKEALITSEFFAIEQSVPTMANHHAVDVVGTARCAVRTPQRGVPTHECRRTASSWRSNDKKRNHNHLSFFRASSFGFPHYLCCFGFRDSNFEFYGEL